MNKLPLLLVGAGGHARSCIDVIEQENRFAVAGMVGLPEEVGSEVLGYKVIGTEEDLPDLRKAFDHAIVAVGQIKSAHARVRLFALLQSHRFQLPVVISPRAYLSRHATVGDGTVLMHGAIVNAGARIGKNCILNSQALVEHDAEVSDSCHIATNAVLNGAVSIGTETFIGSGSVVRQSVRIGKRCVIGMGQRVIADCGDHCSLPPSKDLT